MTKEKEDHNGEFKKIFRERMRTGKYFTMDGSKMEDKPFIGFASIDRWSQQEIQDS
jgi:hypothetical protein